MAIITAQAAIDMMSKAKERKEEWYDKVTFAPPFPTIKVKIPVTDNMTAEARLLPAFVGVICVGTKAPTALEFNTACVNACVDIYPPIDRKATESFLEEKTIAFTQTASSALPTPLYPSSLTEADGQFSRTASSIPSSSDEYDIGPIYLQQVVEMAQEEAASMKEESERAISELAKSKRSSSVSSSLNPRAFAFNYNARVVEFVENAFEGEIPDRPSSRLSTSSSRSSLNPRAAPFCFTAKAAEIVDTSVPIIKDGIPALITSPVMNTEDEYVVVSSPSTQSPTSVPVIDHTKTEDMAVLRPVIQSPTSVPVIDHTKTEDIVVSLPVIQSPTSVPVIDHTKTEDIDVSRLVIQSPTSVPVIDHTKTEDIDVSRLVIQLPTSVPVIDHTKAENVIVSLPVIQSPTPIAVTHPKVIAGDGFIKPIPVVSNAVSAAAKKKSDEQAQVDAFTAMLLGGYKGFSPKGGRGRAPIIHKERETEIAGSPLEGRVITPVVVEEGVAPILETERDTEIAGSPLEGRVITPVVEEEGVAQILEAERDTEIAGSPLEGRVITPVVEEEGVARILEAERDTEIAGSPLEGRAITPVVVEEGVAPILEVERDTEIVGSPLESRVITPVVEEEGVAPILEAEGDIEKDSDRAGTPVVEETTTVTPTKARTPVVEEEAGGSTIQAERDIEKDSDRADTPVVDETAAVTPIKARKPVVEEGTPVKMRKNAAVALRYIEESANLAMIMDYEERKEQETLMKFLGKKIRMMKKSGALSVASRRLIEEYDRLFLLQNNYLAEDGEIELQEEIVELFRGRVQKELVTPKASQEASPARSLK